MAEAGRAEGYSRRHRFGTRGAFGPVLRSSQKLRGKLAIVHVVPGRSPRSRLGIALTKRLVPSAVVRSRVKRLAREAFRRHPVKSAGVDCVITLRERFDGSRSTALVAELQGLFDSICAAPRS